VSARLASAEEDPMRAARRLALMLVFALTAVRPAAAADKCLAGDAATGDVAAIAATRAAVEAACPCGTASSHRAYVACARDVVRSAVGGTLRKECQGVVVSMERHSTCGSAGVVPCLLRRPRGAHRLGCMVTSAARCTDRGGVTRIACPAATHCIDAGDSNGDGAIAPPDDLKCVTRATVDVPSAAAPAHTPGSAGVTVTNPKLLAQFGSDPFSLNNARYTRFRSERPGLAPDAILILVPGFEGGATDFKILAENLIPRLAAEGVVLELWAFDRRTNQLEDRAGVMIAEQLGDPLVALDWLFGGELGLTLSPALGSLGRRAVFYDTHADVPFIAEWTNLVFSRDIDAVVAAADAAVKNHNVFLGGHSAGTGFTARYAATDFNLTGVGAPEPGYAKLRGLVLLEGAGGSAGGAFTSDTLDRIEAKFDGGLFGAVRDNAGRCVDGTTPCTIASEATDCAGQTPPVCTETTNAYAIVPGILNPRILAVAEPGAIQGRTDTTSQVIIQVDQGAAGNNAVAKVPDLASLAIIPPATPAGALGTFIDDDGIVAQVAPFVATSVGAVGPVVGGLRTWLDIFQPLPASVLPNNGPPPTTLPGQKWGQEKEVTDINRMPYNFVAGATNFTDWYYPSAGQSVTSISGKCSSTNGTCTVGNVGAPCSGANQSAADATCSQSINLDSTALSVGRGRRDIENLTQVHAVSIPVICFGGTNGLAVVPGVYEPFAASIATCTAPSCTGAPRVVDASSPNPAFPTFGDVAGGFEVYMNEGFAHLDVVTAEDNADNNVLAPLAAFIARNVQ
jgi:pimeloyl-ACP methyl ester carboxylesterase